MLSARPMPAPIDESPPPPRRSTAQACVDAIQSLAAAQARFDARVCDVVYAALCELLANVRKHARATTVKVSSGTRDDGFVFFRVADDGVGIGASGTLHTPHSLNGLGLWSVEHRLNQ